ncbi:MAG TPA: DUF4185 domain-containing protein [Thermodesulfobacteriota bacterium]|nr:DUF4185 domain-containing protein [Thermodesulfobacteriota bacterium]
MRNICLCIILFVIIGCGGDGRDGAESFSSPHPRSLLITGISFDWSTHKRLAPGSDNWAITWADDGHQYTVWGDGGGFGGTNKDGRVSLGVARIEGSKNDYKGFNVWGGKNAENPAQFEGKSEGIISIGGSLYMWRNGDGSGSDAFKFSRLYKSTNRGATWTYTGVEFNQGTQADLGFFAPCFLQFGQDYKGARDNFVYIYAPNIKQLQWDVQFPGEITLMRVPIAAIENQGEYEFFSGLDDNGNPTWTSNINNRKPVFQDPNGVMRTSVSYNQPLDKYFLVTEHVSRAKGNIGIFEADEPWGPWRTVLYEMAFGAPNIEPNTFYWNFSNKWLSADGRNFVLVFTGKEFNDSWNTLEGTFLLSK